MYLFMFGMWRKFVVNQPVQKHMLKSKKLCFRTNSSGIRIVQDVFLFGLPVQVEAHFHHEHLAVVRLTLAEEDES